MSFAYTTALELKGLLAARSISPVELVEDTLSRQEALEPKINAFVTRTPEVALAAAREAERAIAEGRGGRDRGAPHLGQGPGGDGGRALDLRLPALRGQRARFRRALRGAGEGGRRLHHRQVHHQRVRLQGGHRQPAHRDHAQPVEPGEDPRRLQRRRGRERRRRAHALCGLHRRRRLRAHSVCALRALRHQGAVRPGAGASRSRLPPPSPTWARSRGRSGTPRCCSASWQATTAAMPSASPSPCRISLPPARRARKGMRIAWSPTLGYAEPEPEIVALCEAAAQRFEALGCEVELVEDALGDRPGRDLDGGVLRRHRHQAEGPDDGAAGGAGSGRGRDAERRARPLNGGVFRPALRPLRVPREDAPTLRPLRPAALADAAVRRLRRGPRHAAGAGAHATSSPGSTTPIPST